MELCCEYSAAGFVIALGQSESLHHHPLWPWVCVMPDNLQMSLHMKASSPDIFDGSCQEH